MCLISYGKLFTLSEQKADLGVSVCHAIACYIFLANFYLVSLTK